MSLYDDWIVRRWETPVSDWQRLVMVSLVDDGALSILLEETASGDHRRFRFTSPRVMAYRNNLEDYRLDLWKKFHCGPELGLGWTWIIERSSWASSLVAQLNPVGLDDDPLLHRHGGRRDRDPRDEGARAVRCPARRRGRSTRLVHGHAQKLANTANLRGSWLLEPPKVCGIRKPSSMGGCSAISAASASSA